MAVIPTIPPGTIGWKIKPDVLLPGKTGTKVNIVPEKFDELVDKQGVRVKVFRSTFCARVKSIDGAEHEIDCNLCHGEGFIDRYCLETWAFLQNINLEKGVFAEGLYDGNSLSATFLQGVELQYFTLVELQDFTDLFIERVKRQEGTLDILKYPGTRVHLVIDHDGKEYFEGNDFCLDDNGNMKWCANRGPDADVIYSIEYETKMRFRAVRAMHANRFVQIARNGLTQMVKMNEQWLLTKSYLVTRKDKLGNVLTPNKIRDSDEE